MPKLKDLCTKASSNIRQSDLDARNGDYPVYGASGFIKNVDFYAQEKPYVAVVKDGAGVGRVMYLPAFSSVIGTMQYIIPNTGTNARYLAYAIDFMNLSRYCMGATIPYIYFKDYQNEELPPHSEEEQNYIASFLEKTDALIRLRQRQLAKLDELLKAQFIEMFGDVVRNNCDWPLYLFSEITTSRLGKMLDAKQQTGKYQYPYLANFNVQWFQFALEKLNKMDFSEDEQVEFSLKDGDLLVCEGGEIGRCAVWHDEIQPCYFQKAIHRVRCNKNYIIPDYLAWWFKYNCDHGGFASIEGDKATISHLPGAKLKALKVAVPPLDLQERFAAFLEQSNKAKSEIQRGLEKMKLLKKACMREFFG